MVRRSSGWRRKVKRARYLPCRAPGLGCGPVLHPLTRKGLQRFRFVPIEGWTHEWREAFGNYVRSAALEDAARAVHTEPICVDTEGKRVLLHAD